MSYTPVDFVSDQLQAAAPDAEWDAAGHDRLRELAEMLVRAGIRDISKLRLRRVKVTATPAADWLDPTESYAFTFDYEGRTIGYVGEPDKPQNLPTLKGLLVAWSAVGKGNINYEVQPRDTGFAIVPRWASSSDAGKFREALMIYASFIVSFALPAAGIAVGQSLGAAIMGSYAATYPTLTAIVGNVALGTAMSGGDLEGAVKNAVLAYAGGVAGGYAGGFAADATGIAAIGKIASAATSAFVQGKDVEKAILYTGLAQGAQLQSTPEIETETESPMFDLTYGTQPAADPFMFNTTGTSGIADFQFSPDIFTYSPFTTDSAFMPPNVQSFTNDPFPITGTPSPIPSVQESVNADFDFSDVVKGVSQAAMAALQVLNVYRAVNTTARAVTPQGVVVASDNGLIQTRTTDGRVISTRPPVNQPQSTLAGNVVVNNGDGTYTLIDQYGNSQRMRYPTTQAGGAASGLSGDDLLKYAPIAIAGVVAFMALSRK